MKAASLVLLILAAQCFGQEASPQRWCHYDVHISRVGPASVYHDRATTKVENVAALKKLIETIAPGCRLTLTPIGDIHGESEFWHAFTEIKTLCEARGIEFRVRSID